MLQVKNLKKTYVSKGKKVEAIKGISFETEKGEIFAILGPNGAGKTTTIKSILRLIIPDEGEIYINGIDVHKHPSHALKYVSAVLEGNRNIHWKMTVYENLKYFGHIRGLGGKYLKSRISEILDFVELTEKKNELAGKLSRGMQQRLAIGIALLPDTPLILLDEPTLGLDVESSLKVRQMLEKLAKDGKTILLSTHDMQLVEKVANHVLIINKGKVVVSDKKEKLLDAFKKKRFKISFLSNNGYKELKKFGTLVEENGEKILNIQIDNIDQLYEVLEHFKSKNIEIKRLESVMVNFEEVFVNIVRGDENGLS
ncbi:ABC transporter ATP-binding protein [Thermosipho africanus H17ap60334]|uniref:ABC transporter ATP-binding protein n=1 Tax=Thermosipho TaxID=2420 RepID=UPI00028CBB3B|nr:MULTISPECIES: ABC transporter ATP-binding protein [Thermosipho]EKF50375.1 ABC transporter ATP-binding protein [Thermosipho africanus H17ap60334]MBZ4650179.1 transporter ATP-binding protein [Thermosipho sp. (in: thermotogales)]MDK2839406.1 type transport system ATP-binding protein [Thermosipho sp. (in: thermotogales)]MDK2900773.1 type transport system ATP-binding protein [Thermosipho sp. (in: thermotogales)]RDI90606.1 ABC transporter ATP-binding protein [Thermosipho africanus Ob7]